MPELPEVETIRRSLTRHVAGRTVTGLGGAAVMMRRPLDPSLLRRRLVGRTLLEPRRRGKFLLLDTDPPGALLVHLGMSGRLLVDRERAIDLPHTHLSLELAGGGRLLLVDPRRFGLACWLDAGDEATDPSLAALGIEPLDPGLPEALPRLFRRHHVPVKSLLLDQRLVAGVGNIYTTEALWRAGVRPSRRGDRTSEDRLAGLAAAVQAVLTDAVRAGGTTIRDFATPDGDFGNFAVELAVYGRAGEPCPRCRRALLDARIGGRGTVWCARCQR